MKSFSTVRFFAQEPWPDEPFVFRYKLRDIPNTVIGAIQALPAQCRAVVVSTELAMPQWVPEIERAARRKNMRVIWRKT